MRTSYGKIIICFMVAVGLLSGCAKGPLNVKSIAKTEHPAALLEKLDQDLSIAKKARVDLLSPTWYVDARASYRQAKAELDKGAALAKILEHIATGQAQLAQANLYADKSHKYLADVIESRDAGFKAGADQYKKEFGKLEADFIKLTEAVEDGDMGYVRNRKQGVNGRYRALELRAIKDADLKDVRQLIRSAESLDMDEMAPKSYRVAKTKLADADAVITKNRYDRQAIENAVAQARFYSQRMHQIALASEKLADMEDEDIALWMEGFLAQTNTHLKTEDRRNLSFKAQQNEILNDISMLQRNQSSSSSLMQAKDLEIKKLKQRIADLEGRTYQERAAKERIAADKERLAAEKRFNELYNKVQSYFSAAQAEVYKKSQHLVIRLKGMQFPVGQSVIVASNYPLMTTVQKAIHAFGEPDVLIEGHTDSTGSEALNQKLSQDRAESVRQYLIANGVLPANKITARGFGSSRPLASNATARGRAINRRIDVIIKPVMR